MPSRQSTLHHLADLDLHLSKEGTQQPLDGKIEREDARAGGGMHPSSVLVRSDRRSFHPIKMMQSIEM
jgi:hypothetical protein